MRRSFGAAALACVVGYIYKGYCYKLSQRPSASGEQHSNHEVVRANLQALPKGRFYKLSRSKRKIALTPRSSARNRHEIGPSRRSRRRSQLGRSPRPPAFPGCGVRSCRRDAGRARGPWRRRRRLWRRCGRRRPRSTRRCTRNAGRRRSAAGRRWTTLPRRWTTEGGRQTEKRRVSALRGRLLSGWRRLVSRMGELCLRGRQGYQTTRCNVK